MSVVNETVYEELKGVLLSELHINPALWEVWSDARKYFPDLDKPTLDGIAIRLVRELVDEHWAVLERRPRAEGDTHFGVRYVIVGSLDGVLRSGSWKQLPPGEAANVWLVPTDRWHESWYRPHLGELDEK